MTKPVVDVVIPVYGKIPLLLRLLESLKGQSRLGRIVIVDDASPDADRDVLNTLKGENITVSRNSGNEGFIHSVNRGVKKTDSPYVLILNSDTEATHPHCLDRMAENLDDGAAVCGALLVYPKNDPYRPERIQHAGIYFDSTGFGNHIMSGFPHDTPAAQVNRRVPAVTGACLMIHRTWWDRAGGFDKHLAPAVFEDVDLCLTIGKLGGEIVYEPKSMWFHAEHGSQGQNGINWFTQQNVQKNFSYLMMKHGKIEASDKYWFKGV